MFLALRPDPSHYLGQRWPDRTPGGLLVPERCQWFRVCLGPTLSRTGVLAPRRSIVGASYLVRTKSATGTTLLGGCFVIEQTPVSDRNGAERPN